MSLPEPLSILMYACPTCEDSDLVRDRFHELGLSFREINIDEDEGAARYVEEVNHGFRSTPTIVFGEQAQILVEPTLEELDAALRQAGYGI
jgi:mycoredoxin